MMYMKQHIKLVLIGNAGVGKSALMNQYVSNRYSNNYKTTIGADFFTKCLRVDGRPVSAQIWDTAGTERFQSLGAALYRGTDCCLMVFDVSSSKSFNALDNWHKEFLFQGQPAAQEKFPFVVIANKTDLEQRQVSPRQAQDWCNLYGAKYYETSAKEGVNVEEAFLEAIKLALTYHNLPELAFHIDSVNLSEQQVEPERKKCEC